MTELLGRPLKRAPDFIANDEVLICRTRFKYWGGSSMGSGGCFRLKGGDRWEQGMATGWAAALPIFLVVRVGSVTHNIMHNPTLCIIQTLLNEIL